MSITATTIHQAAAQFGPILRTAGTFSVAAMLLVMFRPLLIGILRAALLVVRPRRTKDERRRRAQMRDMRMMQKMIASSSGPSHAAELRAMASRG